MKLLMLISLLPAVMAEFDACDRANGEWIGFDQGTGQSRGYAATSHGGNIYVAGVALGNFSFATKHVDGFYTNHAGVRTANHHDTLDNVLDYHFTGSADGSRVGMDFTITKITETGVPEAVVFAADLVLHGELVDNKTSTRVYGYMTGIAGFAASAPEVVAVGSYVGDLTVPMNDGTDKKLANPKFVSWDYNGVVMKVDMATGKALWATNEGMTSLAGRQYANAVATTALGHVIATGYANKGAGRMAKYDGATGTNVWMVDFEDLYEMNIEIVGETAFVTGTFTGAGITKYGGNLTSCEDGEDGSAFIASFDVSSTNGPVAKWMKLVGCGKGKAVTVLGDSLFVAGELKQDDVASALDADGPISKGMCTLAGNLAGYLAKLNKADGTCAWAKDTAAHMRIATDGTHVWATSSASKSLKFSTNLTLSPEADSYQIFSVKYDAADGAALWVERLGGAGSSRFQDMTITPTGPVIVGYSKSEGVTVGDVTANNLQHARVTAVGAAAGLSPSAQAGDDAMLVIQLSKSDKKPSCVTTCTSGKIDKDTVVASGFCYADAICVADGKPSPGRSCFQCKSAVNQFEFQGPSLENHCYIDTGNGPTCVEKGLMRPAYSRYSSDSVCESCNPSVDTSDWSIMQGFFQDADFANNHDCQWTTRSRGGYATGQLGTCAPNNYGILFTRNTNGCQMLPDVPMPTTKSAELTAALVDPTVATVAAVGSRVTRAIAAVTGATSTAHSALVAAWYQGNQATCTKVVIGNAAMAKTTAGPCEYTPAAHADSMAVLFETNMHYGHSIARIKVQQALAILHDDLTTGTATATKSDIQKDIVAHMLIPMYQGAIKSAYEMDTATDKVAAQNSGAAYWSLIHTNVPGFNAADKARLTALFGSAASGEHNYCEVKAMLQRNLPDGSMLQYGQQDHTSEGKRGAMSDGGNALANAPGQAALPTANAQHVPHKKDATLAGSTHGLVEVRTGAGSGNPIGEFRDAVENVHLQERDIGVLLAAADSAACVMPPPTPPPPAPPPHVETVVLTLTASGSVGDYSDTSGLQQKIATAAGVDKSLVTISVTAASVIITATIAVPAATTATAVQASLSSNLGTTATAMTTSLGITVESDLSMTTRNVQESSDSGLTDGEVIGIAIGATVGGIVLLVLVGLILRSLLFKDAKPVFTCLEKSTAETKAPPV